jgi:hypothetical protein
MGKAIRPLEDRISSHVYVCENLQESMGKAREAASEVGREGEGR